MENYQRQYIENMKEIEILTDFYASAEESFDLWYEKRRQNEEKASGLKKENIALLSNCLFPKLDALFSASEEDKQALEEFADALMDWKSNLDCGVYILIHDALLSMYRYQKDRAGIIKELYKLGMGLYYQSRMVMGVSDMHTDQLAFRNEMVFTEAGSYLKYFARIEDEETKGYIIRALANIAICTRDRRKRVHISSRILKIIKDPYYRDLAPGIPWDVFERKTHQQMSANRDVLKKGNLNADELAEVLESCEVVFRPEKDQEHPNVRWLWPYYEMEYSCGFVDLDTTLHRMEQLIMKGESDTYDISAVYASVQLPVYYGRLLRDNPQVLAEKTSFLNFAYQKMMRTLMRYPIGQFDDYLFYALNLVITDYLETPGVESYRSVTIRLMQRFSGGLFVASQLCGDLMRCYAERIYTDDPSFFDDIPFIRMTADPEEKKEKLLEYAYLCGLYHNFGLIKLNMYRVLNSRNLFEDEYQIYQMHALSGYDDLKARKSTQMFADIAFGHHSWYNESGGYPDLYERRKSPYRQMTDLAAVCEFLLEEEGRAENRIQRVIELENRQFSPLITAYLSEQSFRCEVSAFLEKDMKEYYRNVYEGLSEITESESSNIL